MNISKFKNVVEALDPIVSKYHELECLVRFNDFSLEDQGTLFTAWCEDMRADGQDPWSIIIDECLDNGKHSIYGALAGFMLNHDSRTLFKTVDAGIAKAIDWEIDELAIHVWSEQKWGGNNEYN